MLHGVNPKSDENRVERQIKERHEMYERRTNQRTTNPSRGQTSSPLSIMKEKKAK